eukprot:TRINITY_DN16780_c0_g1_i1.p1 TRINITY_DN16780_c0_g1~~TRINITY_DN16780_c0_g1_i1.p1  ORF type:complete len:59 (-),score=8.53 TRINITY_DN16780_c0_g1_i1:10-186(-)
MKLIAKGNFGEAYSGTYMKHPGYIIKVGFATNEQEAVYETILLSCIPKHQNIMELTGI